MSQEITESVKGPYLKITNSTVGGRNGSSVCSDDVSHHHGVRMRVRDSLEKYKFHLPECRNVFVTRRNSKTSIYWNPAGQRDGESMGKSRLPDFQIPPGELGFDASPPLER